jgi:ribosomal protein S18 acetylase RimI-like enzyme
MKTVTHETRFAKLHDVAGLVQTHDDAWRSTYRGLIPGSELEKIISKRGADWWQAAIARGNRISLLIFNDEIAGYINYGRNRAKGLSSEGEIYELYLKPEYQGLGFGTQLFNAAKLDLKRNNIGSMVAWALTDNELGMTFFRNQAGRAIARSQERFGTKMLDKTAFSWAL